MAHRLLPQAVSFFFAQLSAPEFSMSRISTTWLVFIALLFCIGLVLWQIFDQPQSEKSSDPTDQFSGTDLDHTDRAPNGTRGGKGGDLARPGSAKGGSSDSAQLPLDQPVGVPDGLSEEEQQAWIHNRTGLLMKAGNGVDDASLRFLLTEYTNPNATISAAAYAALRARHDENALPYLETLKKSDLPAAKEVEIDKLIEYINKPSYLDHLRATGRFNPEIKEVEGDE